MATTTESTKKSGFPVKLTAALVALCVVGAVGAVALSQRKAVGVILDDRAQNKAGSEWVERVKTPEGLAEYMASHCAQSSLLLTSAGKPVLELNPKERRPVGSLSMLPVLGRLGPSDDLRGAVSDWDKLLYVPVDQVNHRGAVRALVENRQTTVVDYEVLAAAITAFDDRSAADTLLIHANRETVKAAAFDLAPFSAPYLLLAAEGSKHNFEGDPRTWIDDLVKAGRIRLGKVGWEETAKLSEDEAYRATARQAMTQLNRELSPAVLHEVTSQLGPSSNVGIVARALDQLLTDKRPASALALRGFELSAQRGGGPKGSGQMISAEPGVVSVAAYSTAGTPQELVMVLDDLPLRVWETAVTADSPAKLARALVTSTNAPPLRQLFAAHPECQGLAP